MVHRTPMPNLMPPVPPFRLVDGPAALLILDLQPFTTDRRAGVGAIAAEHGIATELEEYYEQVDCAIANTADLLAAFRDRDLPVIFTCLAASEPAGSDRGQAAYIGWLPPPEDPAAAVIPRLAPRPSEPVLRKTTFNPFSSTPLESYLRERAVEVLVLAGVSAGTTVYQTAMDAADLGFGVLVVSDACPGDTYAIHDFFMTQLVGGLIRVRPTSAVLQMLQGTRT
jgi:nicotinamidase-related amidase